MPNQVVNGAMLTCSFGMAPSALTVMPVNRVQTQNQPAATIQDHAPNVNIMPFGMCAAPTNPQVAAATAAALGVLTPQPGIPATTAPWVPGAPTVQIGSQPALDNAAKCLCMWWGVITVTSPGEVSEQIP
jgi:hypothetical protein